MPKRLRKEGRELSGEAEPLHDRSGLLNVYVYERLDDENGQRRYWFYAADGVTIASETLAKRPGGEAVAFKPEEAEAALGTLFAYAEAEH